LEYSLQHFVPQFYLKRFADSQGLIWVYDKDRDKVFSTSPRNLAAERGFYSLPDIFPDPALMERQFAELEEQAAKISQGWLDKLEPGQSIAIPSVNREIMSLYLTIQLLRTSEARTLLARGIESHEGEIHRDFHIALLWDNDVVKEISDWVFSCSWIFRFNSMAQSLHTSDDPVKVRSHTRHLHWAQTSVKGAYLLVPLTPKILMYCFEPRHWKTLKQLDCKVLPMPLEPELVKDANTQQAGHARRFIFSDKDDFLSAREFCHDNSGAVGEKRERFNK
jgi:hypothetical protein